MNLRFIDWIWHVRGSLPLAPGQSADVAFGRLDPFFRQSGTSHQRTTDTLTFTKKGQLAQDKMSVFDSGSLRIEQGAAGSVLRYDLVSRALLFCFLAPFMFLAIAQLTIYLNKFEKPPPEAAKKHKAVTPMNPVDKWLRAPAPEPDDDKKDAAKKAGVKKAGAKPGVAKKDAAKEDAGDGEEGGGKRSKKPSPKPAYAFAYIFTALYAVGRILEDRLIRKRFKKRLVQASPDAVQRDESPPRGAAAIEAV